jgi:DNA-binding SARP family transcriptional activator
MAVLPSRQDAMEFRILGPLDVRDGDRTIPLAGGRQRALLALLILNANETVSTDRLVEELWGARAPATAPKVVQNHVSQLRRALEGEAKTAHDGLLLTQGSGYALRLEPGSLDLDRFEQLLEEGRRALAREDAQEASELLREALALWRGPPLADFTFDPFAQTEIARLEERRIAAVEERIEADLALGRHPDLVSELEALIPKHPLRERLRGQLMLALYRSGRQSEALRAYQETRRTLVDELGIEPGPTLQQLERLILQQDSSLDLARRAGASVGEPKQGGSALIGRERELAVLLEGFQNALSGRGRLFLIAGEPGIGKSRLADELAERARERGALTLFGRAWEAGGAPAYWPWVQAIRSYVRDRDPDTVREQLGSGAADVAQMLPELRELLPEIGAPPSLDPEGARFRLFDATASFFRRAAVPQPIVLVLDDLHAADAPSLLLLEFIAQQLHEARILAVAAYRDVELEPEDPLSSTLTELARHATSRLQLTGLDKDDVGRFIEVAQGVEPPQGLLWAIHSQTEGNPLFVGEILRLLAAEGRLNDAVEAPGRRLVIPPTVREVIGRRLRRLSDDCRGVLTLASVLGREFDLEALVRVSEHDLDALLPLLDEAISARVVEVPGAHRRLVFAHALIRDSLYDELPAMRRMRLHQQVGEVLEALYASDPDPHLAELAYHSYEAVPAGDATRAVRYAQRAGDRAATLLAYEEAARLYALGLETIESQTPENGIDCCELLLRLGDVQARAGNIPIAKKTFLRAAAMARGVGLPDQLARAALGYGGRFVWGRTWGDRHLVPLLEEALTVLPEEDSELRVRLLARLAGGPLRDTLPPEPRDAMSQKAVEMARRLGDPATLAYALDGRLCANWGPEHLDLRLVIADELIQVGERAGEPERAYEGRQFRYWGLLEAGDVLAARVEHEAKTRLANELRQPAQLWDVAVDRATLALFEGRFAEAETAIPEALEVGRFVQSPYAQLAFHLQLYALRREQGRLGEVVGVVERAVDDYPAYPVWRYVLADVFAELDRREGAHAVFEVLAADGFPVHVEMQWLFSISLLPDVCRYLASAEWAVTLYEFLLPYAQRNAHAQQELCWGSVSRGLGILAGTMTRWDEAAQHFEFALRMNAEMGARPWLAYTQYDYGLMLLARSEPGDHERAQELLASAKALSQELAMSALTDKVSALSNV